MTIDGHVNLIVVGGGAAGLSAAVAAEDAGLTCRLLEAQDRLGGRVRARPLETGGVFDEGAQMVNGDMSCVLDLAERAGLVPSPVPQTGIGLCVTGDEILRHEELISLDEVQELLDDQIVRWDSPGAIARALWLKWQWWTTPWESVGEAARGARHLVERPAAPPDSLAAALRALLLDDAEEAMAASLFTESFGAAPDRIDARAARDKFSRYGSAREDLEFHFAGGMTGIIDRLAADLGHEPCLETPVHHIRGLPDRVEVTTDRGVWTADHVIVAVPPPAARRIRFDIDQHDVLYPLLASFAAGDMIKTVLVFETPFWRLDGLSGWATFTDPAGLVVVDTGFDTGLPPRLTAFQGGPLARDLAGLSPDDRRARLLAHLSRAFGDKVNAPREIAEAVWVDHLWSGGGYNAAVRVGGDPDAVARLSAWDGRVRFAGSELAGRFWGYVEGAILSGRHAVAGILGQDAI